MVTLAGAAEERKSLREGPPSVEALQNESQRYSNVFFCNECFPVFASAVLCLMTFGNS